MGDLGQDTAVRGGDGSYTAELSADWNIWGPNGGYVVAVALRAAGAHSAFDHPASLSAHLLGVARFGVVDLEVTTLRRGRRAESIRVSMTQDGTPICETMVWTVDASEGMEHDWTEPPDMGQPLDNPSMAERFPDQPAPPMAFWGNIEGRMVDWLDEDEWNVRRPLDPRYRGWFRFVPTATFDDPYVDAARTVVLLDVCGWPAAATRALPSDADGRWIAPNMDLSIAFHQAAPESEYLFLDGHAPLATGGLVGATGRVWSEDGRQLATAVQQMLCRPVPQQ